MLKRKASYEVDLGELDDENKVKEEKENKVKEEKEEKENKVKENKITENKMDTLMTENKLWVINTHIDPNWFNNTHLHYST